MTQDPENATGHRDGVEDSGSDAYLSPDTRTADAANTAQNSSDPTTTSGSEGVETSDEPETSESSETSDKPAAKQDKRRARRRRPVVGRAHPSPEEARDYWTEERRQAATAREQQR